MHSCCLFQPASDMLNPNPNLPPKNLPNNLPKRLSTASAFDGNNESNSGQGSSAAKMWRIGYNFTSWYCLDRRQSIWCKCCGTNSQWWMLQAHWSRQGQEGWRQVCAAFACWGQETTSDRHLSGQETSPTYTVDEGCLSTFGVQWNDGVFNVVRSNQDVDLLNNWSQMGMNEVTASEARVL